MGNCISLAIFGWMFIKGNKSFHQCSVLHHVTARTLIVSDTYYWSLRFLKAEASAQSFPRWYCRNLERVKNPIMPAASYGCRAHLREHPNVPDWESLDGVSGRKSLEERETSPPSPFFQDPATAPSESCPPSSPSGEFLLSLCWNLWLLISRCCRSTWRQENVGSIVP